MTIRELVYHQIQKIAEENGKKLPALNDNLRLLETGFDSLCMAIFVAALDDETGLDPLTTDNDTVFPMTIGEWIALYESAESASKHVTA